MYGITNQITPQRQHAPSPTAQKWRRELGKTTVAGHDVKTAPAKKNYITQMKETISNFFSSLFERLIAKVPVDNIMQASENLMQGNESLTHGFHDLKHKAKIELAQTPWEKMKAYTGFAAFKVDDALNEVSRVLD